MEESLATFISNRRENLGMSSLGLAKRSGIDIAQIEDIESGKELFLPVTVRQKLARALKCQPIDIQKYERQLNTKIISDDIVADIKQRILNGEDEIFCPMCGSLLITRIAKMYDLEDNLMLHPKAHCSKCVFQIKD